MFVQNFLVAFPLFALIGLGFLCTKLNLLTDSVGTGLSKYAFVIALPMLLFNVMSNITHLPPPNWFIAIAFFGSCFIVFVIGRVIGDRFLKLNGKGQTIFGMTGVFSNNVQLGIPIAISLLGQEALPSIAVIFSLNGFLMWTLATIAIEISRNKSPSIKKTIIKGTWSTLKNPIVVGILAGTLWGFTGLTLPTPVQTAADLLGDSASTVALFAVGIGLAKYKISSNLGFSLWITLLKLGVQPLIVLVLCQIIGLGPLETKATCLMACLPVGVNVYIMSQEFNVLQGATANALLITTTLACLTVPLTLAVFGLM
ncbi:AEC family transporter [Turicimonas sp. TL08]